MNSRNDPGVVDDLAKKILSSQSKLNHYKQLAFKENLLLKLNEEEIVVQMNEQNIKNYETHELSAKIHLSTFVNIDDEAAVPSDFLVSLGFRVDKAKIHRKGKCPSGTSFRSRQNLTVFKK